MLKETEDILIKNSRLAVANSKYISMGMGAIVMSGIYFQCQEYFFGSIWFGLATIALLRLRRDYKLIKGGNTK